MTTCYIGIGSNIGDRYSYIDKAIGAMRGYPGIIVKRVSDIYETEPVSDIPQGRFLNGVVEIKTRLSPRDLLKSLNLIEKDLGRSRIVRNGPRTIDLDILYYGDEIIQEKDLVIPHPRINEREFVLRGLRQLGRVR
ncbi:MAG: 2-amino-4-hydroxy-6-hydroxymethyldihydropteridine diphosphokinase [Candidatus Omnitrophica bacterium]|nr:2-amino-4-hydroxy-6-hydroxymethyldihydropteridine diphosphokinase [Candidatus Omnitrophota bacterium]